MRRRNAARIPVTDYRRIEAYAGHRKSMSTLNPDLISKDMDAVLNDAVPMLAEYRKSSIMPEMVLLALLAPGKHGGLAHAQDV